MPEISRRNFMKRALSTLFALIATGTGGYYYAREIEPKLLEIKRLTVTHSLIPRSFDQFKIVQFSDTHLGFQYTIEQLEKLVERINQLEPDIVFFTGDLMDQPNKYLDHDKIAPILQNIQPLYGKFAVYGNHDHGGYGTDIYRKIMENCDFILLQNEFRKIQLPDGSSIHISGLDDALLGKPDLGQAVARLPADTFNILLSHEPDIADQASGYHVHLQLSGHSHGGQVKIPFAGALYTPPYSDIYHEGLYEIYDASQFFLYVNRGLGTTRLPFRFLSRPELTLFTLTARQ
nr:metallophosphoesterase [uncultured Bacillus sp.]